MLCDSTGEGYFPLRAGSEGELVDARLEKTDCQVTCLHLCFAGAVLVWEGQGHRSESSWASHMLEDGEGQGTPACWRAIQWRVQHVACLVY